MKMRVADYITHMLYEAGGEHVFVVTGGMIMHLTDALLLHPQQKYVCCHFEQAATMAAEAYGRFTGNLGVAYVTAGPGALNTITGVVGAFVDSSPCIIVAGQSKVSQAIVKGPRQFALQGFDNLPLFENVTKYAVMLVDVAKVKYEVEKCINIAKSHRVGPVYIECPIDIQGATFDPDDYEGYTPPTQDMKPIIHETLEEQVGQVVKLILRSRRPCILAGAGIRLSGAVEIFYKLIDEVRIPVLTSRLGMDLIDHEHPLFVGRPGTYGDRAANFTIQNCDLLLNIGCRMGIGLVGYDFQDFAPVATIISVDIDKNELTKPAVKVDIPIISDAGIFISELIKQLGDYHLGNQAWVGQTQLWKDKYPVDLPVYSTEQGGINSYRFTRLFSERMPADGVFVLDTGSCFHVYAQAFKVKFGQRHIITGGLSTMGYMPGAIGVATAHSGKDVYCITGDGSIQMNLQELQTIAHYKLRVKIVIFNNNGYLLIRQTQINFQGGRLMGEGSESGVSFPDMKKIADAYGIQFIRISSLNEIEDKLTELINYVGPVICEVMTPANQVLMPRVSSRKLDDGTMMSMPYDDMFPFLSREEYLGNCIRDKN
jgi:acetolactate synthase-1/2/3 large subunit